MAWYKTGSAAVVNGSPVVNAAGADFVSNGIQVGWAFIGPDGRTYEIAGVNSATQIVLASNYLGASASSQGFAIQPTSSLAGDLALAVSALIATYQNVRDGIGQGLFPDGTVNSPAFRFAADQDTGLFRNSPDRMSIVTGGTRILEIATVLTSFADTAGGTALDLVGRSTDSTSTIRFINTGRSTVLGAMAWDSTIGITLTCYQGSTRIGASDGAAIYFRVGNFDRWQMLGSDLKPAADNLGAIGAPGQRVSVVYAATGAINTSDERSKKWRGALTADELAAAREIGVTIGIYQMLDAVAAKGDAARLHVGVKAQQVISILEAHGLNPMRYAFVCYDEWDAVDPTPEMPATPGRAEVRDDDGRVLVHSEPGTPAQPGNPGLAAGNRYGIRYDELSMFILAAQELRLAAMEQAVEANLTSILTLAQTDGA